MIVIPAKKQKSKKKKTSPRANTYYKIDGDKLIRKNQFCTRCGPGTFMSNMYDRLVCGKCGYTIFKKRDQKG
ncbi:MAG: 30S ribosomal protein S27ae [Candidatus Helarchaeota archaeon]